jgi:carboxyl-terminal processing protease
VNAGRSLEPRDPAEIERYLLHAVDLIAERALYRDRVNWHEIRDRARQTARGARSYAGTHRLLYQVLKEAGGRHSYLKLPYQYPRTSKTASPAAAEQAGPAFPDGELRDQVAVLRVPALSGHGQPARRYTATSHAVVRRLAAAGPRGWVLDLRDNGGGNMWPMLAGIGALLAPGVLGYFVEPDGSRQEWSHRRHFSLVPRHLLSLDGRPVARLPGPRRDRRQPVAVLTSARTASAGEAVLVAVRSQPAVRTFGEPTAGLTTANQTFTLGDGARLVLTVAFYADAAGRLLDGPIVPDQAADDALAAALAWIGSLADIRPRVLPVLNHGDLLRLLGPAAQKQGGRRRADQGGDDNERQSPARIGGGETAQHRGDEVAEWQQCCPQGDHPGPAGVRPPAARRGRR